MILFKGNPPSFHLYNIRVCGRCKGPVQWLGAVFSCIHMLQY